MTQTCPAMWIQTAAEEARASGSGHLKPIESQAVHRNGNLCVGVPVRVGHSSWPRRLFGRCIMYEAGLLEGTMSLRVLLTAAASLLASTFASHVMAETTLERIKKEGVVRIGFANEAPWSFA